MPPVAKIPDMNRVPVFASEQQLRNHAIFDHVRRAPFAGDRDVVPEMPPEIIRELLRPAIHFPSPEHFEALVIEQEYSARSIAFGRAECADVDRIRPAMDRMRTAVTS